MLSKNNKIFDSNYIWLLLIVFLLDLAEDFYLCESLFWKFWIIFYHLQSYFFFLLVIKYFKHLTVRTFPYEGQDLIAICYMVVFYKIILFPIITTILLLVVKVQIDSINALTFGCFMTQVIHFFILSDLVLFIFGQMVAKIF